MKRISMITFISTTTNGYRKNETALVRWKHELRLHKHFILFYCLLDGGQFRVTTIVVYSFHKRENVFRLPIFSSYDRLINTINLKSHLLLIFV